MIEEQLSERIALDSIIVTDRTRKEFRDISSLVDSMSSVGLLQPLNIAVILCSSKFLQKRDYDSTI
jgi:hypothetical protein